jgi:hypothetical protein
LGELEGHAYKPAFLFEDTVESTFDRAKVEWIIKARKGTKVRVSFLHERAGSIKTEVVLK